MPIDISSAFDPQLTGIAVALVFLPDMSKLDRQNGANVSFINDYDYEDSFSENEDDDGELEQSVAKDVPLWDTFKCLPPEVKTGSMRDDRWFNISVQMIKLLVYCVIFCVILFCCVLAKSAVLFAVSQLREDKTVQYCHDKSETLQARITESGRITWIWYIIFIFFVPECYGLLCSIGCFFFNKKQKMPTKRTIAILFFFETLHPIGLALLVFVSLPGINSVEAAMISSCLSFVPALLNSLSSNRSKLILLCNVLALIAQGSGMFLPLQFDGDLRDSLLWIFPVSLVLSSCRWWNNYVSQDSHFGFIRMLAAAKNDLTNSSQILQGLIALWRSFVFLWSAVAIAVLKGTQFNEFFIVLYRRKYEIELLDSSSTLQRMLEDLNYYSADTAYHRNDAVVIVADSFAPFNVLLVQAASAFVAYQVAKFAYKTRMHRFGFALPISLVAPSTICLITLLCHARRWNPCAFDGLLPNFLFFEEPNDNSLYDIFLNWYFWCWLFWWFSQLWIAGHLWSSECEKLAVAEKIFCASTYDSTVVDQFLSLNKRKRLDENVVEEDDFLDSVNREFEVAGAKEVHERNTGDAFVDLSNDGSKRNSCNTQIYVCATMWHEEKEEMNNLIGSILRLDKEHCAMRFTQKYYKVSIEDYYELETHIFFDDAFCCIHGCSGSCCHDENETQVNQYVLTLVETVQKSVEDLCMVSSPPIKYPAPYGGRLMWTLPGKTRLMVHLKDKNKIRCRKRWSQVMYMYYLLGFRLMGLPIDMDRKEAKAQNTYILTLDGDIDFRPGAVKILLDLMKKDEDLGAACGRIHPVGNGPMVWFQKFEYAIGHWLQKSTEHTIGSVLCSPGCFSLFRANALMQHNVMAKYATKSTEPRHYVQYDQGEDRWLCTLILQVGSRVEYSAASDAYTHAPEAFRDFYIQRRRWIPSTVVNIFDLLNNSKETRAVNSNISWLYIVYQWFLMGSTIIGPGTIFLMLVGALNAGFDIDNWTSLWYNLVPIVVFVIACFLCKESVQITVAHIITVGYSLMMIAVLVGMMLQIAADGWSAPTTLFFLIISSQLIIAGLLHPREWTCLFYGVIYYITVPSMYMLLNIFSIFNIHNVTWGTRETRARVKEMEEEQPTAKERCRNLAKGQIEFSLAGLFKCILCTIEDSEQEEEYLNSINKSIDEINIRLEEIRTQYKIEESQVVEPIIVEEEIEMENEQRHLYIVEENVYKDSDSESERRSPPPVIYSSIQKESAFLIHPSWVQDEHMRKGEVHFLSNPEEDFWKQMIEKYLHPIDTNEHKQKEIAKELINMRNQYLLKFFMINALYVMIVFLMQLNKDELHLQWVLGMRYNITHDTESNEVRVYREYLKLEPIGCVFIATFVTILLVQFLAMLVHRFDTFSHILANTKLSLPCDRKKYLSEDVIASRHAEDIARGLQHAAETEAVFGSRQSKTFSPIRRITVHELEEGARNSPKRLANFETFFRRVLRRQSVSGRHDGTSFCIPREAMEAFDNRRSKILANRRRSRAQTGLYDQVDDLETSYESKPRTQSVNQHEYQNLAFSEEPDDRVF